MPHLDALAARNAILHLLQAQHFNDALRILERASQNVRNTHDWHTLAPILEHIPESHRLQPTWATQIGLILVGTRNHKGILDFTNHALEQLRGPDAAPLLSAKAWALLANDQTQSAHDLLTQALPHLSGTAQGQALKRLAQAQHELSLPWQATALEARTHLHGRLLGLALIDEGYLHRQTGALAEARTCLNQALAYLRHDPYHLAWAHHNLSEVGLARNDPDAEHHALEATRLSKHTHARALRARALCGLGNVRRRAKDLRRAEAAYKLASQHASETDDQRTALWSLAKTQRLQGRPHDALEQLHQAIALTHPTSDHPIHVELAATWLALGHHEHAQNNLPTIEHLLERHADLARILQAELHRQASRSIQALQTLEAVDLSTPHVAEEAPMWPDLFALAHLARRTTPNTTKPPTRTEIHVHACGPLRVLVNGCPVRLKPTGRPGELLVLLLEHHGQASSETLTDQLWPNDTKPKNKALWELVKHLREALGWPESIGIHGRVLTLDPHSTWHYDAQEARASQQARSHYLQGIYSNWALEVARELENLPRHLN